jgi:predicted DNA binding protein
MADLWRKPYHVVLEVENKNCRMLKKFDALGLRNLKVTDIRSSTTGAVKHLIELSSKQVKMIPGDFKVAHPRSEAHAKTPLWFESEGCEVCNAILSNGAFLVSGKSMEGNFIMYSFMVPSFEAYTGIISTLEKSGHKVTVLKTGRFEPKTGVLTEKQESIFWVALRGGFFDYPRKIGLRELSAKLDVKPSTLSEIIRRGTRRLLEHHFQEEIS